jgi:hypothetical protein
LLRVTPLPSTTHHLRFFNYQKRKKTVLLQAEILALAWQRNARCLVDEVGLGQFVSLTLGRGVVMWAGCVLFLRGRRGHGFL